MISFLAFQHLLLFQGIFSWWEQAHSVVIFMLKDCVEALPCFFLFVFFPDMSFSVFPKAWNQHIVL